MGKLNFIFSRVILMLVIQRCSVANAIECLEGGTLSILPQVKMDKCTYNLDVKFNKGILQNTFELSYNESIQAVCYSLWGIFRGESIIIRGCDALPISNTDATEHHCLDNSFKVWFETEAGKEYITDHKLCVCNDKDYCNFHSSSFALTRLSVPTILILLLILCLNLL